MAVWQFRFTFIPRSNLLSYFHEIPKVLTDDVAEEAWLYQGIRLPKDVDKYFKALGAGFPLNWSSESLNFGDYDSGSHLTIQNLGTAETEIWGRLHAGMLDTSFVQGITALAAACDCMLHTYNETVIEADPDILVLEVMKSGAYRFCNDPVGYLASDEIKEINWSVRKKIAK